ncbi:hypothetical protein Dda_1167 [Drechslerella dactyloides]|uniref:Uncharacterized protein n=1 Tax=Drechslerella dactyloides TaxID=74499 RepID=A0AAD6NNP3_DREDA|nr:hypothetical protein Dda_1167 [Drechslerella dactyloides]
MRIKHLFPEIQRPLKSRKDKVVLDIQRDERQIPRTPVLTAQRPRKMSDFIRSPYLRRHSSSSAAKSPKKLSSVAEEEEMAFNYQMALLEDPPEWDLDDAGIGSRGFESPSHTPPAITASRASSPSHIEKVAESSRKQLHRLATKLNYLQEDTSISTPAAVSDDTRNRPVKPRLSKSLPDLSELSGKGHAGTISQQNQESRGRARTLSEQEERERARRSRSGPPSWRIPPRSARRPMPHVREASPLPSFPLGPVDIKYHESSVMARAMWKNGEVRYEDQWGRRLVPIGRQNSFMFELWPVSEITEE